MRNSEVRPQREVHSDTDLPKKDRNISNTHLTLCLQEFEEQPQREPRASIRKELTKTRTELNNIETKTQY